jgi:hypothetical protein
MHRTYLSALILAGLGLCTTALAQVEIEWSLRHSRTLLMEPVRATVRIANYTGQSLDLTPNGNARLRFDVEDQPTSLVRETGQPLVRRPVIIPSGETRDRGEPAGCVSHSQRPVLHGAAGARIRGERFLGRAWPWKSSPAWNCCSAASACRTARCAGVTLRQHRERTDRLFFRLDAPTDGTWLGCYELGRLIRFFVPRLEQDSEGVFHVLHQSAPDRFVHSRLDSDGTPLGTAFYIAEAGQIRLVRDADGRGTVAGGTPFEEDPERPGVLTAPTLPPAHPYAGQIGELPPKGRARPAAGRPARARPAPGSASSAEEAVVW